MRFCVHCGAARGGTEAFCTSCGQPLPAAPEQAAAGTADRPDGLSSGRWPTHFVAAWVALALVAAGTTVGVLVSRAENAPPTGHSIDRIQDFPTDDSGGFGSVPTDTEPTDTEPTDAGSLGAEPTDSDEPTDDEPTDVTPTDPNGVVVLSDSAALDPAAAPVLSVVSQYFQAINSHDYQLYYDLHTAEAQAALDPGSFRLGFESTEDSDATVTVIGLQPDGSPTAEVTFTSHQESVDGPNGDTCDTWDITLFLEPDGDQYLIGSPPDSYHASFAPC